MPCRDARDDEPCDHSVLQEKVDKLTRFLCTVCALAETKITLPREIAAWWEVHQEIDRQRIKQEEAEKQRKTAVQRALSKLTPADKRILGLDKD